MQFHGLASWVEKPIGAALSGNVSAQPHFSASIEYSSSPTLFVSLIGYVSVVVGVSCGAALSCLPS